MRKNDNTPTRGGVTRFTLGQTFITPGAQEAIQIAGQTEIEFLRRHMSGDWGDLSDDDIAENETSLKEGFRFTRTRPPSTRHTEIRRSASIPLRSISAETIN